MNESESKNEKPEKERRFDPELLKKGLRCDLDQYERLKRCSDKKDITEWNEWRKKNKDEDICLEGANFKKLYLVGAEFISANLNHAEFFRANLKKADFHHANLKGARLQRAHLEGTDFSYSDLRGTQLPFCPVDGSTIFFQCEINNHTWLYGVALNAIRIEPWAKPLLEYNVRRRNWQKWYWGEKREETYTWLETPREKRLRLIRAIPRLVLTFPVRWFWSVSNYGLSTWRIIGWFLMLSLFFAAVYSNIACWYSHGIVSNLTVEPHLPLWHYFILCIFRPIYFSVVTMTTLGFGDMYANANSILGHLLLTIQVILGYVLLGALVTRFAVLFTAGGPAGKFVNEKKNRNKTAKKIKN
jgi:hypothetical protein